MRHPIAKTAGNRSTEALATLGGKVAVSVEEVELTGLPGQRVNALITLGRYEVRKQVQSNKRLLEMERLAWR